MEFPREREIARRMANKVKDLRTAADMTQKAFAEYFGIPYRTIQNWEGSQRECPSYLFVLMKYKLVHEGYIKEGDQ